MTEYLTLTGDRICRELFCSFRRHQVVTDCRRRRNGRWVIESDPFIDDWSEKDYQFLVSCLKRTVSAGGFVCGAFIDQELKGFVSVEPELFGRHSRYLDLSSLHVSEDFRGQGIGKELFSKAALWAREQGADRLYISSHSAVETQAFYRAMGCVEAEEYQAAHVEAEPYDCQLEYRLCGHPGKGENL